MIAHNYSNDPETAPILQNMLEKDTFSKWMGIIVDDCYEGYCRLHYQVRADMLNAYGSVHGGILFSAADSAFAFACNAYGRFSVALDVHISFISPAKCGDNIFVEAREIQTGFKTGFYSITTTSEKGDIISVFTGTAYRSDTKCMDLLDPPTTPGN